MSKYLFTCKICKFKHNHASEIQDHMMKIHNFTLDETYDKTFIDMRKYE